MSSAAFILCRDCDLLQRGTRLAPRGVARCGRCGAELYRDHPHGLDHALPYTLAAIVLFVVANSVPILGLQVKGELVQSTLIGAIRRLFEQDMAPVAGLVALTMILAPLAELGALAWLLLPLKFGRVPPALGPVFHALTLAQSWSMVEVFMLGVMVALVKLAHLAHVVPGMALWSFAGLMLLLAAANAAFDPRAVWDRVDALR